MHQPALDPSGDGSKNDGPRKVAPLATPNDDAHGGVADPAKGSTNAAGALANIKADGSVGDWYVAACLARNMIVFCTT